MNQSQKEVKKTSDMAKNSTVPARSARINLPASNTLLAQKTQATKIPTKQSTETPKATTITATSVYGLSKTYKTPSLSPSLQELLEKDKKESQINVKDIEVLTSSPKKQSNQLSSPQKPLEKIEKEKQMSVKNFKISTASPKKGIKQVSLEELIAKDEKDSQIGVIKYEVLAMPSQKESQSVQMTVKSLAEQPSNRDIVTPVKSSTATIQKSLLSKRENKPVNVNNSNDNIKNEKITIPKGLNKNLIALEKEGAVYRDLIYYLEDWAVRIESDRIDPDKLVKEDILPIFDEAKKRMAKVKELQAFYAFILIMDEDPNSNENTKLSSFLSNSKLDVNYYSSAIGRALLHEAVLHGKLISVITLLKNGANARIKNKNNRTPLMLAFFEEITKVKLLEDVNESIVDVLIGAAGNPIDVIDSLGESVEGLLKKSYEASKHKDKEKKYKKIKEKLDKTKIIPKDEEIFSNKLNKYHHTRPTPRTPQEMYEQLRKIKDIYPDLMQFFDEISANGKKLSEKYANSSLIEQRIKAKHKVRRAQRHERNIIEVLISYFEKLLDSNDTDKIRLFIGNLKNYNISLNIVDDRGESLLHKAVFKRDSQTIGYLLRFGINCNLQDKFGRTALHGLFLNKEAVIPLDQVNEEILWDLLNHTDITIEDKNGDTIVDYFNFSFHLSSKNAEICRLNNKIVEKFGGIVRRGNEEYAISFGRAKTEQEGIFNRIKFNAVKAINDGIYVEGKSNLKVTADKLLKEAYDKISENISIRKKKNLEKEFGEFKKDLFAKIDSNYFEQYVQPVNKNAEDEFQNIKQDFELDLNSLQIKGKTELAEASGRALEQTSRRISPHIAQAKIAEYKSELQNIREKFLAITDKHEGIKETRPQSPGVTAQFKKSEKAASFLLKKTKQEDVTYRSRAESFKDLKNNFKQRFLNGSSDKLEVVQHHAVRKELPSSPMPSLSLYPTSSSET